MKLKRFFVFTIFFVLCFTLNKGVSAEDLKGDIYAKENIGAQKANKEVESELPKEVKEDLQSASDIKILKDKTNKEYEVAVAEKNGNYKYVDSTDNLNEAISKTKKIKNVSKNKLPIILKSGVGYFSEYSIGRIVKIVDGKVDTANKYTVDIYPTEKSKTPYTYINHGYIDDAPIIEDNGKRIKTVINGYVGWIEKEDSKGINIVQVPLNQAINLSYYMKNSDGSLVHYISYDVTKENKGFSINIGKAPQFMNENKKYYSYDGNYFYNDIKSLTEDYKNNTKSNAVNRSNPYYNYYNYLPGRSYTGYSANEINNYINNNTPSNSILRNKGQALIDVQNKYGVNAMMVLGVAMNESARGTSQIAISKNNIFGLNAVDSDTGNANSFVSVESCIKDFAKNWMSIGYMNPVDWRYNGSALGNKFFGINVKYASDPFWGEKASSYCFNADKYLSGINNLKDFDKFILGMYEDTGEVRTEKGLLYYIKRDRNNSGRIKDTVVINKRVGEDFEVNPDSQIIGGGKGNGEYNWESKGYINNKSIKIINNSEGYFEKSNGVWYHYDKNGNLSKGWVKYENKWYFMNNDGVMQTGWIYVNNKWYYLDTNGMMLTGWKWIDNNWFYLDESSGEMQTGWKIIKSKWYYLNEKGAMQNGWQRINEKWYYLNEKGEMQTGWLKDNKKWYYLDSKSGAMVSGWIKNSKFSYYLDSKDGGAMATGWKKVSGKWYFFKETGEMVSGWLKDKGEWYYLDINTGAMVSGWLNGNGTYYYLDNSGRALKGWNLINKKWYYFYKDCSMAKNTVIDGWKISADGSAKKI